MNWWERLMTTIRRKPDDGLTEVQRVEKKQREALARLAALGVTIDVSIRVADRGERGDSGPT